MMLVHFKVQTTPERVFERVVSLQPDAPFPNLQLDDLYYVPSVFVTPDSITVTFIETTPDRQRHDLNQFLTAYPANRPPHLIVNFMIDTVDNSPVIHTSIFTFDGQVTKMVDGQPEELAPICGLAMSIVFFTLPLIFSDLLRELYKLRGAD